jgi:hypothetical protein
MNPALQKFLIAVCCINCVCMGTVIVRHDKKCERFDPCQLLFSDIIHNSKQIILLEHNPSNVTHKCDHFEKRIFFNSNLFIQNTSNFCCK